MIMSRTRVYPWQFGLGQLIEINGVAWFVTSDNNGRRMFARNGITTDVLIQEKEDEDLGEEEHCNAFSPQYEVVEPAVTAGMFITFAGIFMVIGYVLGRLIPHLIDKL